MRKTLSLVLVMCMVTGLIVVTGCSKEQVPASEEVVQLTANTVWPPHNYHAQALQEFAELVKEKTNGSVQINVEMGGALGYKGPELLKTVKNGLVPISEMVATGVAGDEPIFGIRSLPFMISNWEEAKKFDEIARPYYDKAAEKWNQKILYVSPWPFAGLWSKRKITSVEDMKGLKTRTFDRNGALVVEATGGTPLALPFSEVYSSLATDLIDSVITSAQTAVDGKFWEVLDYYQPIRVVITNSITTINLDYFNRLSPEQQQALLDAGKEIEKKVWETAMTIDSEKEKVCSENGVEIVEVSDEFKQQLQEVSEQIRKDWLESNPEAKALYEEYMQAIKK